jgi:polyhydroxyalkanoate synthase
MDGIRAGKKGYPMNPLEMPLNDIMTKWLKGVEKSRERILKSKDVLLGLLDTEIAKTPYDVVYQEDRIKHRC